MRRNPGDAAGAREPRTTRNRNATTIAAKSEGHRAVAEPDVTVLVVAWYPDEPQRVGELAVVPAKGARQVLGRGEDGPDPRLRIFRARPGRLDLTDPLWSAALSRRQLELEPTAEGVDVLRVGRCPMRVNGVECDSAVLRPGDTLRLRQELVLFCTRRPARIPPVRHLDSAAMSDFGEPDPSGILGESPAVWTLRDAIAFAAKADAHALLHGESGTGKELAARAVHRLSRRSKRALVSRNAATIPSGLIDAELFGNVRNYPNPGMADRAGLIGEANGGYLFLDEIGELPSELQARLLRVLDSGGEYQRLGESTPRFSDFRLLAATNRDPGQLKHDLLARLTVRIDLPSLAQRREDIPLLARHLVIRAAYKSPEVAGRFVGPPGERPTEVRVDAKLIDELLRHDYVGNTRTLDSILWAAMASSDGDVIAWSEAAFALGEATYERDAAPQPRTRNEEPTEEEIRSELARVDGSVTRAAQALGLSSRYALYRLMAKLGIDGKG
jgi:DNA-binding NtrC family response regulator